ncbi:hypothetical protein QL285_036190 [Trifolium repens]|jgi:hypothetical protein|nr:hypothetical protein QL285_036190 [Trifolium repens]
MKLDDRSKEMIEHLSYSLKHCLNYCKVRSKPFNVVYQIMDTVSHIIAGQKVVYIPCQQNFDRYAKVVTKRRKLVVSEEESMIRRSEAKRRKESCETSK